MIPAPVGAAPSFVEREPDLRRGFDNAKIDDAFLDLHRQGGVNPNIRHTAFDQFPKRAVEVIAARLAVIAEPIRIRLLELLNDDDATVGEISERLRLSPEEVSQHLDTLHAAGFVSRQGSRARYHLIDWTDWWVVEQVARNLSDQHRPGQADRGDVR